MKKLNDLGIKLTVFSPLKADHPVIGKPCWICNKPLLTEQRPMLKPSQTTEESGILTIEAKLVHATCGLRGLEIKGAGIIERIKDGDGSPFEVIMTNSKQFKLSELGLD